ncbi:MAG TPA: hypothetical protein VLB44_08850, partial [Kofleriaceae bacterium]|nr:hypothetical protein [Kofleriaceae bacterium]
EFEGQRARDEAGLRARYIRTAKDFTIRALFDAWTNPSTFTRSDATSSTADDHVPAKLDTYVRTMMRTTDVLWLGIWERFQDKDLREGGHNQCYEVSTATDENGEPIPCSGRQLTTIGRMQYIPNKQYQAVVQLEHQLLDDNTQVELKNKFRQDIAAWFIGYYRPDPGTRIRVRVRYLDEAINDNTYLERSVAALGEYSVHLRDKDLLRVRVDGKLWLDKRDSTLNRVPNPEATLWLFYQAQL